MITKETKDKIMKKYGRHPGDTGSPEVQIAILSHEMGELAEHLKSHKKDFSSRRGLLKKVSERRKMLRFLERESEERFDKIVKALKLKISKKMEERPELPEELTTEVAAAVEPAI